MRLSVSTAHTHDAWLTLTHGLTQPLSPDQDRGRSQPSGYGYEFGFLTRQRATWPVGALGHLITYLKQSGKPITRGHRVPMWFYSKAGDEIASVLGKVQPISSERLASKMKAVVFWPHMSYPGGFSTSTGYFTALIGTTITQEEWDMAKATSSAHLLLLLFKAGIGQISDLQRSTVTDHDAWRKEWDTIGRFSPEEADRLLISLAAPKTGSTELN